MITEPLTDLFEGQGLKISPDSNEKILDLDYNEDSLAQVDANFIICESGKIAEIQVTGEEYLFNDDQFQSIFGLAKKGIYAIIQKQKADRQEVEDFYVAVCGYM